MTYDEKLLAIANCVEMEPEEITPETVLEDLENWDSVAVLSIIAVISENFGRFPSAEEILQYKTVADLAEALE